MSLVLALLAQVGALNTPGAAPPLPHEQLNEPLRPPRARAKAQPAPARVPSRQQTCIEIAEQTPADAEDSAAAWLASAQGPEKAVAGECLGVALSRQDKWADAETAFAAARDASADKALRARLGAMAGNAALARGDGAEALTALDSAHADAAGDAALTGGIAVDRARALVSLKRNDEAGAALAEAREVAPDNAQAWLLSATLSRRMNKLPEAQAQIEKAAALLPVDPEIGLEAGVIAVLAGRNEAARKSWQSVLTTAPDSEAAATAKGYLAQLGAAPSSKQAATKP
jgi:tetratricopeptide (TPR) repeat protein